MGKLSRGGVNQGDLIQVLRALRNQLGNAPGLAMGTTTTAIKTTNSLNFGINGVRYTKAAQDNVVLTGQGLANTAAGQFCKIRVEVNSAGTLGFVQGGVASSQANAQAPTRSPGKATVGIIEVPASFTFGTTAFNVGGVAFQDGDPDLSTAALEA
jgi:hypothetical protein